MVLDVVVRSSRKPLGDLGPLVTEFFVRLAHDVFLILRPVSLVDVRVQVVVPALAALLARATRNIIDLAQAVGDERPALGAVLTDHGADGVVLCFYPHSSVAVAIAVEA